MARKTYAQIISDAQVMVKGIRDNETVLAQRKIGGEFADELLFNVDICIKLNGEQESLKAKLKEKTKELDAAMTSLSKRQAKHAKSSNLTCRNLLGESSVLKTNVKTCTEIVCHKKGTLFLKLGG